MKKQAVRFLALLLAASLMTVSLAACGGNTDGGDTGTADPQGTAKTGEPITGGSITVGIAQDINDSLDPHSMTTAGTRSVLFNVYEGLVKPDPDGNLIPAVASNYNISDDGKSYTFTLRDGVKFHNGEAVTVEDIVYSINRCAGDGGEPRIAAFSSVVECRATSDTEVVITLDSVNIEFLASLTAAIIPEGSGGGDAIPSGTGPFVFVSRSPQENVILEKFDEYWGNPAYLDRVEYKIIDSSDTLIMSLKSGVIDVCPNLTSSQAAELGDSFNIITDTMRLVQALYINNAVEPFNDIRVRQAICYAIDKQGILDLTADGEGVLVGSSMYPAFTKYFMPELSNYYEQDIEKAKSLLAEAGYENGFDMTITVPSTHTPHVDVAQVIIEQLKVVGITATLNLVEWTTWLNDVYNSRSYETTVVGLDASTMTARAMLERFVSDNGKNFANFSNEEYDELFAEARACTDDAELTEIYKRMQTILAEDAANAYIQDLCDFTAVAKGLDGLTLYPMYVLDLASIYYVG